MTIQHVLAFARRHDWGQSAFINAHGRVVVTFTYTHQFGDKVFVGHERCTFATLAGLRAAAGY